MLGVGSSSSADGFIGQSEEWRGSESNPGVWQWVLTATMSQPQVPRDQQCSQHCWAWATVTWPWSSSVMLSECRSCKSGLGFLLLFFFFSEKQPPPCDVIVQPGSGKGGRRRLCIRSWVKQDLLISGGVYLALKETLSFSPLFNPHFQDPGRNQYSYVEGEGGGKS